MSMTELAVLALAALLAVRMWLDYREGHRQSRLAADHQRRAEEEHRLRLRRLRLECKEIRLNIRRDQWRFE